MRRRRRWAKNEKMQHVASSDRSRSSTSLGASSFFAARRSVTLDLTSVTLLGQYDTWSVSRPNLPPFRACEHASSAVLHGSPETLITGNSHACPKCEPTRARPNCLHNPPSMPQRSASRDALFVNEAQLASRICQQTALTGGPTLPIWAGQRDQKKTVHI